MKVYDQDLIYGRVIGMLVSSRDPNFDDFLSCELVAYPPSMFCADRQKNSKGKSILGKNRQVTISERNCSTFVRYFVISINTSARMQRAESSRVHNVLLDMPTPQKQVIISVTKIKFN